jgi:hypothetical protein
MPASSLPLSLSLSPPGTLTCAAPLTGHSLRPPAPGLTGAPLTPHTAAPHVPEPLAACRLRGHQTPSSPSVSFPHLTASPHSNAPESFLLSPLTPLDRFKHHCLPVFSQGHHHVCVPPPLSLGSSLTYPSLSLPYRDDVGSPPTLASHPPPPKCHHSSPTLPPHRRPTASVSHGTLLLVRHVPRTPFVFASSTFPCIGHR